MGIWNKILGKNKEEKKFNDFDDLPIWDEWECPSCHCVSVEGPMDREIECPNCGSYYWPSQTL